ncbi:hypothetical protein [Lysobacter gummosus]|uniref:hypothetical protein n=1 Tax=Lysobacter gummosus TaxID=262324 RepID=UPI003644CC22
MPALPASRRKHAVPRRRGTKQLSTWAEHEKGRRFAAAGLVRHRPNAQPPDCCNWMPCFLA